MPTVACPDCANQVSTIAPACPSCGRPWPAQPLRTATTKGREYTHTSPGMPLRVLPFSLSGITAGFLWVTAVAFAVAGTSALAYFGTWRQWRDGSFWVFKTRASVDELADVETFTLGAFSVALTVFIIATIVFFAWFFNAYRTAQSRGAVGRQWGPGWTIGGWLIPVVNLVIPKLVMNEVDKMSSPEGGAPPLDYRWRSSARLVVSDVWWITWITALAVLVVGGVLLALADPRIGDYPRENEFGAGLMVSAFGYLLLALAAVLGSMVVVVIGRRLRGSNT